MDRFGVSLQQQRPCLAQSCLQQSRRAKRKIQINDVMLQRARKYYQASPNPATTRSPRLSIADQGRSSSSGFINSETTEAGIRAVCDHGLVRRPMGARMPS
jgi:hypothetical protein